jgi:Tfp pilus assembly pilus retraction ATPase PilT
VFQDNVGSFSQRELGRDVDSMQSGLEGALREDPDVLMVGETRSLTEFEVVLNAAESGRLVVTTFHSSDAERLGSSRCPEVLRGREPRTNRVGRVMTRRSVRSIQPSQTT